MWYLTCLKKIFVVNLKKLQAQTVNCLKLLQNLQNLLQHLNSTSRTCDFLSTSGSFFCGIFSVDNAIMAHTLGIEFKIDVVRKSSCLVLLPKSSQISTFTRGTHNLSQLAGWEYFSIFSKFCFVRLRRPALVYNLLFWSWTKILFLVKVLRHFIQRHVILESNTFCFLLLAGI